MKHAWLRMDKASILKCPNCTSYTVSQALGDHPPAYCSHCGHGMSIHWQDGYKAAIAPRDEYTKITVLTLKEETF